MTTKIYQNINDVEVDRGTHYLVTHIFLIF